MVESFYKKHFLDKTNKMLKQSWSVKYNKMLYMHGKMLFALVAFMSKLSSAALYHIVTRLETTSPSIINALRASINFIQPFQKCEKQTNNSEHLKQFIILWSINYWMCCFFFSFSNAWSRFSFSYKYFRVSFNIIN